MKIFFIGDFTSNTGPGQANKIIMKALNENKDVFFSKSNNKIGRVIELLIKTVKSDCICFCSYSKLNFIGIKFAKLLRKPSFYLMHGYRTYESMLNREKITNDYLKRINRDEKYLFSNVTKVFCVSKKFMELMKVMEPEFVDKFDYNYNGLDFDLILQQTKRINSKKKSNQIISLGGGMKQKNNLTVCKAIEKLNREKNLDLNYIVIGHPYGDKELICKYDFVKYYDYLPYEKVLELMAESYLYIQNSIFETFGLAILEALYAGCNILVSENVGVLGLLDTIESNDLICNTLDENEIAEKIEHLLYNGNSKRLMQGVNINEINYLNTTNQLLVKISKYIGDS